MKNLTWQNPEQLFVAQELINKVKSKCCGIKVIFNLNKPLYVSELEHGDSKQCTYITGKDNGLTTLQLTIGQSDAKAK